MPFGAQEVAGLIRQPTSIDDKYARGVLGLVAGSERYPGAAVLAAEAAVRTGVGMVRLVAPKRVTDLVLSRRPEVVPTPGRVHAWVLGPGLAAEDRGPSLRRTLDAAIADSVPVVLDAGALDRARQIGARAILTPHAGELARLLGDVTRAEVEREPERWARAAHELTGATVVLKGSTTVVVDAQGVQHVPVPTHWLATAGSGDVLAGVLGALLATHAVRQEASGLELGAAAVWLHGRAAELASGGGPIAALDVAEHMPAAIRAVLERVSRA